MNNNLVLLCGKSATGKSASLQMLKDPEGVMYLNCENNKKLPFRSKFQEFTITDPTDVPDAIDSVQDNKKIHTIVIDSLTYLMDMFESTKVLTSTNTMKASKKSVYKQDEEYRVWYVGVTRTIQNLYLVKTTIYNNYSEAEAALDVLKNNKFRFRIIF